MLLLEKGLQHCTRVLLIMGSNFTQRVLCVLISGVYPEPWFLYVALLLVPVTVLIGLLSAMLMCR